MNGSQQGIDWEAAFKAKDREFTAGSAAYKRQEEQLAAANREIQLLQGQVMGLSTKPIYAPLKDASLEPRKLPPGLKFNNLEPFHGRREEDVEAWIFIADEQFALWDVTLDSTKITMAGTSFHGEARTWYYYYTRVSSQQPDLTWDDFKKSMKKNFMPQDPIRLARDKLSTLTHTFDLTSYTSEYRKLIMIIPNMHEDDKIDKYLRGLKPWMRREVDLRAGNKKICSLEDAISLAVRTELADDYRKTQHPYPHSRPIYQRSLATGYPQVGPPLEDPQSGQYHHNPSPKPQHSMDSDPMDLDALHKSNIAPVCTICGSHGHSRPACPLKPNRQGR